MNTASEPMPAPVASPQPGPGAGAHVATRDRAAWWRIAGIATTVVVLLGIALGRPDADHFRFAEVASPTCTHGGLDAAFTTADFVATATATRVSESSVELIPDHVYYGATPQAQIPIRVDRRGWTGVTWAEGTRYIVVAHDGALAECGQTQAWNPLADKELRAHYR